MSIKDNTVFEKIFERKDEMMFADDFIVELYQIQALNAQGVPEIVSADENIKELFWKSERIYIRNNYDWALGECKKYGTISTYIELLYYANRACKYSNEVLYTYLINIHKMHSDNRVGGIRYYLTELLKPVQSVYATDPEKAKELVKIEINFFGILEWENMKCFQSEIKRTPDTYAEMASIIFKKDGANKMEEITEEQNKFINAIRHLYDMAHFCPAEKNGTVDSEDLKKWIDKFKKLLLENQQTDLFGHLLGRLWAYSPAGADDYYPCEAVREIIEKYVDESMVSSYKVSMYNRRGIFSPSAGREERAIAEKYKNTADYFKIRYPKTAEIFYAMYREYIAEAEEERNRAENGHF